jgi:hypothetical protein
MRLCGQPAPGEPPASGANTTASCGEPVGALLPGKIVVTWSLDGFPSWRPPTANTTVGGLPARQTHAMAGWCAALGGSQTITVVIPLGGAAADNWVEMDACLRGPGLSRPEAQIAAMLASVRLSSGA